MLLVNAFKSLYYVLFLTLWARRAPGEEGPISVNLLRWAATSSSTTVVDLDRASVSNFISEDGFKFLVLNPSPLSDQLLNRFKNELQSRTLYKDVVWENISKTHGDPEPSAGNGLLLFLMRCATPINVASLLYQSSYYQNGALDEEGVRLLHAWFTQSYLPNQELYSESMQQLLVVDLIKLTAGSARGKKRDEIIAKLPGWPEGLNISLDFWLEFSEEELAIIDAKSPVKWKDVAWHVSAKYYAGAYSSAVSEVRDKEEMRKFEIYRKITKQFVGIYQNANVADMLNEGRYLHQKHSCYLLRHGVQGQEVYNTFAPSWTGTIEDLSCTVSSLEFQFSENAEFAETFLALAREGTGGSTIAEITKTCKALL